MVKQTAAPGDTGGADSQLDVEAWAPDTKLPEDLVERLQSLYKQARKPITAKVQERQQREQQAAKKGKKGSQHEVEVDPYESWQPVGPVMPKEHVLTHYPDRPNVFTMKLNTLARFERETERCASERKEERAAVFHFSGLLMNDEESNETFEIKLGSYICIPETKLDEHENEQETVYVARVIEIFFTVDGQWHVGVHWMYRPCDTLLAHAVKNSKKKTKEEKEDEEDNEGKEGTVDKQGNCEYEMVLPVAGPVFPRWRLWLCGSDRDNRRYGNVYDLTNVDRPCRVFHVKPGEDPLDISGFDPESDYAFWQSTVQDFHTFEDIAEDWSKFSPLYLKVLQEQGIQGIKELLGPYDDKDPFGQFRRLMQRSRGTSKKFLQHPPRRDLWMMELFCGAGGLSFLAQSDDKTKISIGWANDLNPSAATAYTTNHPNAMMSCNGLEEYLQLLIKWQAWVEVFMPQGWEGRSSFKVLQELPPGRRYSRLHMPQGVGCAGGADPDHAEPAVAAALRGENACNVVKAALLSVFEGKEMAVTGELLEQAKALKVDMKKIKGKDRAALQTLAQHLLKQEEAQAAAEAALPSPRFAAMEKELKQQSLRLSAAATAAAAAAAALADTSSSDDSGDDSDDEEEELRAYADALLSVLLPNKAPQQQKADPQQQQQQDDDDGDDVEEEQAAVAAAKSKGKGKAQQQKAAAAKGKQGGQKGSSRGAGKQTAAQKALLKVFEGAREQQVSTVLEHLETISSKELGEVEEVRDVRIRDCALRVVQGSSKNQTQGGLEDYQCWLEFEVRRSGSSSWSWEHQALLLREDAVAPMRSFMLRMLADKTIPCPGQVDVLTGGPPCQNVSGLNRHATQQQVLNDPKNRLVTCYLHIVEFLRPRFLLMEQVTAVFSKEGGIYARYALMRMLEVGYQVRAGILTAGHYGAPQGRRRAILWGALSGVEQLPPFPAATHRCKNFNAGFPKLAQLSIVGFMQQPGESPADAKTRAYPMCLMGDVFGDMPEVDNFSETEALQYRADPKSVLQAYLRRDPPAEQVPRALRAVYAQSAMGPWLQVDYTGEEAQEALEKGLTGKILQAGTRVLCKSGGHRVAGADAAELYKHPAAAKAAAADAEDADAGPAKKKQKTEQKEGAAAAGGGEGSDEEEACSSGEEDEDGEKGGSGSEVEEEEEEELADDPGDGSNDDNDEDDEAAVRAIGKEKREAGKFAYHTLKAHYTQQAQLAAQQGVQFGTTCCEHTEQGQQQQQRKRKLQDVAEEDAEVKRALQLRVEAQKLLMTQHLGIKRLHQTVDASKAHTPLGLILNALRDHRPYMCNADDFLRVLAVQREGGCFRNMPGVVTHTDGTNCAGSWHVAARVANKGAQAMLRKRVKEFKAKPEEERARLAETKDGVANFLTQDIPLKPMPCPAGGMPLAPVAGVHTKDGNHKSNRVDHYGKDFRGSSLGICSSRAYFLATGDLVCPRWCVTYKRGQSFGRHGCFGRVSRDIIQSTVVTRAEPHNLQVIHATEARVLTVRENARCQGYPDYYVFMGLGRTIKTGGGKGNKCMSERYLQVGNAVAPPVAAALGRCLLMAASEDAPVATPVVEVPDPEYAAAAAVPGLTYYAEEHDVQEEAHEYRSQYGVINKNKRRAANKAAGDQPKRRKAGNGEAVAAQDIAEAEAEGAAAAGDAVAGDATAAGKAAKGEGKAKASRPRSGATKRKQAKASAATADGAAAAGDAAAAAGDAAAADGVPAAADGAAAAEASGGGAVPASGSNKQRQRKPKTAAAPPATGGRRSSRAAAAAATQKISHTVLLDNSPLKRHMEVVQQEEEEQAVAAAVRATGSKAAAGSAEGDGGGPSSSTGGEPDAAGAAAAAAAAAAAGHADDVGAAELPQPAARKHKQHDADADASGDDAAGVGDQQQQDRSSDVDMEDAQEGAGDAADSDDVLLAAAAATAAAAFANVMAAAATSSESEGAAGGGSTYHSPQTASEDTTGPNDGDADGVAADPAAE